ncbi:MAG: thiol-disulfide isomerase [Blastocatellia bacterium AA13]|nr:MAG: thiol-disulfide isomerase [Blastocatellia bacterium AA13]
MKNTFVVVALLILFAFILDPSLTHISAAGDVKKNVTFSKDVAPIFFQHCVDCHRPNDLAPMSLLSYKDARPWAKSIRERVVSRQMPPWPADPHYGKFANDTSLSQSDVDTITAWVDQGAKEGNPKDLPAAPNLIDGWKIGKPDVVLTMQEEYTLAPEGSDEYINFSIPTSFKQDTWVQAAEIHPGNKKVVHHVIAFIQTPQMVAMAKTAGRKYLSPTAGSIFYQDGTLIRTRLEAPVYDDGCNAPGGGIARGSGQEGLGFPLCFYTPGKDTDIWPEGIAKLIPAGANIVIQVHYSKTTGKPEKDRSSVGLILAKSAPEKAMTSFGVINHYFKIPPGADNHEVIGCYTFSRDVELFTYLPHMHVRGKDMKYEVVYPDGRRETLLYVSKYNFNWQTMYRLEKPLLIPKGTKMIVTAHYDNSEKNKYNPDPTKAVRFGDPTYDEMMVGYFDYVSAIPNRTLVKLDSAALDAFAGEYGIGPVVAVTISREGDHLLFAAQGNLKVEAFPESPTKFYFKIFDGMVNFTKDEKGEVTGLVFQVNGQTIRATKVKKIASASDKR